jgi:tetratricopeptide (TPR) repeat protein
VNVRGGEFFRSIRIKSFFSISRVVFLTLGGALLAAAAVNLWAWHHFREASRLVERQQYAKAYEHYAESLKVWRWSASSHFHAARTARRGNLYLEAEQHLVESGRLQDSRSSTPLPLALERLLLQAQSGGIMEVEDVLWQFLKKDTPETPYILEAMARGYLRMLRQGNALRCVQLLLDREPDNVEALVIRGRIREDGGEPEEAIKDYGRALELNPERDEARLGLARVLIRDNPDKACSLYEQVLARQPGNREALEGLAEAYLDLGEPAKARPIFEVLLSKDPSHSRALAGLGALALAEGDAAKGEALLRKAIAADPGNAKAHYQLFLCLSQDPGREEEAAAEKEAYTRIEADRARLAEISAKLMSRTPNDPGLHYELGVIYLRNGKPEVGLRWLYSALKLDPTHQPSYKFLSEYFERTGQLQMAELHRSQLRPTTTDSLPAPP